MADQPSTSVSEKPYVNPQLDAAITSPKQKQKLEADFGTFWDEQDKAAATKAAEPEKTESPEPEKPAAPEPAKEEPKVEGTQPAKVEPVAKEVEKAAPEVIGKPSPPFPAQPKVELPKTEDIESIELPATAPEAQKSQFKQLKEIAKTFATEAKLYRAKLAPVLKEVGLELKDDPADLGLTLDEFQQKVNAWKTGAMSPEVEKELEVLREMSRVFNVLESPEFKKEYEEPLNTAYFHVIEEMAKYFEGPEEEIKKDFLDPLKTKFKPNQLPPEWWDGQLDLMKKAPPSTRRKIENEIAAVMILQDKHDARAAELAKNKTSYAEWRAGIEAKNTQAWEAEVRDETLKFVSEKHPEWRPDIDGNTPRGQDLQKRFLGFLTDLSSPRKCALRGAQFIELEEGIKELQTVLATKEAEFQAAHKELETAKATLETDLESAKEKIGKLEEEVSKKRRISDATTKPTAGTGVKGAPEKEKLPLDARKSLEGAFAKHLPGGN